MPQLLLIDIEKLFVALNLLISRACSVQFTLGDYLWIRRYSTSVSQIKNSESLISPKLDK